MSDNVAFLFPGQASQFVGMGRDWWEAFPIVRELYEQANEVLGYDLGKLSFEGPSHRLNQTRYTQPSVFVLSMGQLAVLREQGWEPGVVAGHSLGEYAALVAGGAMSFCDGLRAVKQRGQLMQKAAEEHPGTMAAIIGLADEQVVSACTQASADSLVQAANFNAPGQVVISGTTRGVRHAAELCRQGGAKRVVMLPVSGAFHSPLMAQAQPQMRAVLHELRVEPAGTPVIDNVTADAVTQPPEIRRLLVEQLTSPVRWAASMRKMIAMGVSKALEVGPGEVLKGLMKRIDPSVEVQSLTSVQDLEAPR